MNSSQNIVAGLGLRNRRSELNYKLDDEWQKIYETTHEVSRF